MTIIENRRYDPLVETESQLHLLFPDTVDLQIVVTNLTTTRTLADRTICHCLQVNESTVADSVTIYGASCVKDVIRTCGAGGGCNSCHARIRQMIEAHSTIDVDATPHPAAY